MMPICSVPLTSLRRWADRGIEFEFEKQFKLLIFKLLTVDFDAVR